MKARNERSVITRAEGGGGEEERRGEERRQLCDQQNKVGLKRKRRQQYSGRDGEGIIGPVRKEQQTSPSSKQADGCQRCEEARPLTPPTPPNLTLPACRASRLRWWSPPPHTSSGISALSGACGPGGTAKTFSGGGGCLWAGARVGRKTAHLPSSGVGLHHRGGALHLLVLSLLL